MSGEDFFKFNSGKEFRFSNFKEIKEEDLKGADEKIKKLFNIFAGDDKVLQVNEAQSLFNALKSAAGDNKTLETDEIKMFTEEKIGEKVDTNIFTTFVNNLFGTKDKTQNQSVQVAQCSNTSKSEQTFLEEAACKEIVIDIIDENLSEAYEILNSQYLGAISGWHDERKDKNDILKTSNVAKVLDYQNAGVEWMNRAKIDQPNGLTKKEYYEGNKKRIKDMILTRVLVLDTNTKFKELKNKYSEEKLAQIIGDYVEALCSNATMEDLKNIQKNFVSLSGVKEVQTLEQVIDNAIEYNKNKNKPVPTGELAGIKINQQKGMIPEYWNSDEPISFEEVYKIERGTEYSQYKIEKYALAKKEMEVVANAYNKKQQFVEFADNLRKDETLNADEKVQKVLEGFADFYALSEDGGLSKLKELITESKLPISVDEKGFNFGTLDDSAKNRALNSLLKLAQQQKEAEFEKFLNGKTVEEYQTALDEAQKEAIGEENGKMMAEAMKNDNLTCIQRWTGNTSMLGLGMTVVGGILCFTPLAPLGAGMVTAGNTLAIGGMVAETGLGVADYATKDVQTAEEAEQLGKNFLMNAGGFIIGMGAGKAGIKAFNKLIDEKLVAVFGKQIAAGNKMQALKTVFTNPEYLKSFMTAAGAKLSADFVISYAGDLAMMGVLDTDDNWQSLLKANLTGILVGMSGDIKDVSGVGRVLNLGISDGVKPMTEMDYGQRLLGNDVTVTDPKTGATVEGTVTGLHNNNGQVEIEVNGQRYSTNDVSGVRGENIAENSLLEKAANENPVWVAGGKIKDKWLSQGLEETGAEIATKPIIIENGKATLDIKTIEEFNQNYKPEPIDEVSKLIFSGKLNETLTKRYEEMGKVFEELGQKYNTKFNELAVKYKDDSAKYAEEVIKILSKEFGMEGFEIPVEFISGNGKTCYFDYTKGKILMDRSITDAKDFTTLLVHEFKHSLQFRDLTAQYGIEGVIDIVINDKSIKPNERNATLNQTLNNSYNIRLLTEYNFAKVKKGSVSDYLNRIYKDEFTDTKTTYPEYIEEQIIEPEAYYSANGKFANNIDLEGRNITKPYTEQEIFELKAKGEIYETSTGALYRVLDNGTIERIYNILPSGVLPPVNNYLQRINKVHFSKNGGLNTPEVKVYESFKRAMRKVLIATDGKAELPKDSYFKEIPERRSGIACTEGTTILINRCFLDNIDSNIKNVVKNLKDADMLSINANGKIHIPNFLKNGITLELEKKLNLYNSSMNLSDKFELYTHMGYLVDLQSQVRRHPVITIEKIMKTGTNQSILKRQGLFKTRQEVNAMSKDEQVAYLKEIASLTGIPDNAVLIRDIDQMYIHELGHLNHKLSKEDEMFLTSKKVINEHQNNPEIQNICSKVTQYAQQSPKEFVAEVYSGLINGQKFDDDVMDLYRKYKGPEVINSTRVNLPAGVISSDNMKIKNDNNSEFFNYLKYFLNDKEKLANELKTLIENSENKDNLIYYIDDIASNLNENNLNLLESILSKMVYSSDAIDVLKKCSEHPERIEQINALLKCKLKDVDLFTLSEASMWIEKGIDINFLNTLINSKFKNGEQVFSSFDIKYSILDLCGQDEVKIKAFEEIIQKSIDKNKLLIQTYDLKDFMDNLTSENKELMLFLLENITFGHSELYRYCKSSKEQLPKLKEIMEDLSVNSQEKEQLLESYIRDAELANRLYSDLRYKEDIWSTTDIIRKYSSGNKKNIDELLEIKDEHNTLRLKFGPAELRNFIQNGLDISDIKTINELKNLRVNGKNIFDYEDSNLLIKTAKILKDFPERKELLNTMVKHNVEEPRTVSTCLTYIDNIPKDYQERILKIIDNNENFQFEHLRQLILLSSEGVWLSERESQGDLFTNPWKKQVLDDILLKIENNSYNNSEDLNYMGSLLNKIVGTEARDTYRFLNAFEYNGQKRFSLKDMYEIVGSYTITNESIKYLAELKNSDGTPRFNGKSIQALSRWIDNGHFQTQFEEIANLKNTDGTFKFDGEAIDGILSMRNKTLEGLYDTILKLEVDGKAKFNGGDCRTIMEGALYLPKEERQLFLELMENPNISVDNIKTIFSIGETGASRLRASNIPWDKLADKGLFKDPIKADNIIDNCLRFWNDGGDYYRKILKQFNNTTDLEYFDNVVIKEGNHEIDFIKKLLNTDLSSEEANFLYDIAKHAIYDNYHGRWKELNLEKIKNTDKFLDTLLNPSAKINLTEFSLNDKLFLLNYINDVDFSKFNSNLPFIKFIKSFENIDSFKQTLINDLKIKLKEPGSDIILTNKQVGQLLNGDFSKYIEDFPFITTDLINKYNRIMTASNRDSLTGADNTILKLSILLGGLSDDSMTCAIMARNMLEKNGLTSDITERVFNMIQNRDWMNQLKEGLIDTDDIAVIFREPNDFDVAKLLSEEDFSIEENANISEKVQLTLDKIYSTAPIIKPTSIPYEQSRMQKVEFEGYEYSVIDFSNPNLDLHRYGFPQGTKKEDVRLLTHFMKMNDKNSGNMSVSGPETMYILCDEVNNTSLSAALIDPNDIRVNVMGRNCAVILEPMSSNYAAAYHDDFTSPLKKGYQEFKDYLLGNLTPEQRNYVSNIYKQVLNLSDDEYIQLYKKLPKKGDISRIKSDIILNKGTINEKIITAEELQNAIKTANNSLYNISGNWSELIIYNPKIKALLYKIENPVKDNLLENCPAEVLEFARKYNLPIIIAN